MASCPVFKSARIVNHPRLPHYAGMTAPVDTPPSHNEPAILLVISKIPRGRVACYGQIAELAGLPGRARLVGRLLSRLPEGSTVPWHRVINASGRISMPPGSRAYHRQKQRLEQEGIVFAGERIRLKLYQWQPG